MASLPGELRLLASHRTLDRLWRSIRDDDIQAIAAEVTFYTLFALFPFLLFVAAVAGMLVPDPQVAMGRLLVLLHRFLPTTTATLIADFLEGPLRAQRPYLLSIGIFGVLWAGSQGFAAILKALSRIYCSRETRSWIRRRALSLALTVGAGLVGLLIILLMTGLDPNGAVAARAADLHVLAGVWGWARWPILFVALAMVLARLYTTVPCVPQRPRWLTPGALVAALIGLLASSALPFYVDRSESYTRLYGSIGDVVVLMLWLYLGSFAMLLGAEIDTAILRARGHSSRLHQVHPPARARAAHPHHM